MKKINFNKVISTNLESTPNHPACIFYFIKSVHLLNSLGILSWTSRMQICTTAFICYFHLRYRTQADSLGNVRHFIVNFIVHPKSLQWCSVVNRFWRSLIARSIPNYQSIYHFVRIMLIFSRLISVPPLKVERGWVWDAMGPQLPGISCHRNHWRSK